MISVNDAVAIIRRNTTRLSPVSLPLANACGLVLAEDVFAPISLPFFHQSAMDGYAFRFADYLQSKEFTLVGEVAAGDAPPGSVATQGAVRIFTGAAVPQSLDTVVMQEKTERKNGKLIVMDEGLARGSNVRTKGSDVKKGEVALAKDTALTPAAIGFLAGLGVTHVSVCPKPTVHMIVTGKELQQPGKALQYGQVYESNSVMLQTALQQFGITSSSVSTTGDDRKEIQAAIENALQKADLILLTGGVSVGDYDFVVNAAGACGVEQLFHKVAQRPGKPLYCGFKEGKLLFGLPGNPASVLSCFYNFVVVALEQMTGRKALLEQKRLPLLQGFTKKVSLTQFLKATYTADGVVPLGGQESFRLRSFSLANCLIVLPEAPKTYKEGETVEILCLPYL